jgi:hypothetical protein
LKFDNLFTNVIQYYKQICLHLCHFSSFSPSLLYAIMIDFVNNYFCKFYIIYSINIQIFIVFYLNIIIANNSNIYFKKSILTNNLHIFLCNYLILYY